MGGGYKAVRSGHIIEVWEYQKLHEPSPFDDDGEHLGGRKKESDRQLDHDRTEEYKKQVNYRRRLKVRQVANANFTEKDLLITLTYAEHVTDIDQAHKDKDKFFRRLRTQIKNGKFKGFTINDFKYLGVIEFTKAGRVHFHILMNLPIKWRSKKELFSWENWFSSHLWGEGIVDIQRLNQTKKAGQNVDNVGAYLSGYMKKSFEEFAEGRKPVIKGGNLKEPKQALTGRDFEEIEKDIKGVLPSQESRYETEWNGEVVYKQYNLKRIDGVLKIGDKYINSDTGEILNGD